MNKNCDIENAEKAAQSAELLVRDLQALHRTDNPFLAELTYGLIETAATLKSKLDRLVVLTSENKSQ